MKREILLKTLYKAICYYNLDPLIHMRYLDSLSNNSFIISCAPCEITFEQTMLLKYSFNYLTFPLKNFGRFIYNQNNELKQCGSYMTEYIDV